MHKLSPVRAPNNNNDHSHAHYIGTCLPVPSTAHRFIAYSVHRVRNPRARGNIIEMHAKRLRVCSHFAHVVSDTMSYRIAPDGHRKWRLPPRSRTAVTCRTSESVTHAPVHTRTAAVVGRTCTLNTCMKSNRMRSTKPCALSRSYTGCACTPVRCVDRNAQYGTVEYPVYHFPTFYRAYPNCCNVRLVEHSTCRLHLHGLQITLALRFPTRGARPRSTQYRSFYTARSRVYTAIPTRTYVCVYILYIVCIRIAAGRTTHFHLYMAPSRRVS